MKATDRDGVNSPSGIEEAEKLRLFGDQRRRHMALPVVGNYTEYVGRRRRITAHAQAKERRLELYTCPINTR